MAEQARQTGTVSLNEIVDILGALRSGNLSTVIGGLAAHPDCDVRCGCNSVDCECRGSVSSTFIDEVSFPELQALRAERIATLRRQLEEAEKFSGK
jgi:hypothetical protein